MQVALFRIWTWVAVSTSYVDNRYAISAYTFISSILVVLQNSVQF